MLALIIDPLLILYYTYQTYLISGTLLSPVIVLIFFIATTALCRIFMIRLVPLVYLKERAEGDLRWLHSRLREWAECVVLIGGEKAEEIRLDDATKTTIYSQRKVLQVKYFSRDNVFHVQYFLSARFSVGVSKDIDKHLLRA